MKWMRWKVCVNFWNKNEEKKYNTNEITFYAIKIKKKKYDTKNYTRQNELLSWPEVNVIL